jgi:hypothetical protein
MDTLCRTSLNVTTVKWDLAKLCHLTKMLIDLEPTHVIKDRDISVKYLCWSGSVVDQDKNSYMTHNYDDELPFEQLKHDPM